ncbi:MAG: flagellar biosynthetic protein FliR [Ignavibacteria bacterium]|jgi:flagellar biosynthetic protein FliR|nr:flagellar biosynthetic protein FliR [Ignavibacteria bacterium]MCU7503755.1 flagellar biosynthetic protein FliR [Ignavibacteria bacterium]MCU7517231.1 flagellar biosynthetic protein FliR [Ignavibacteria bacterium]
MTNILVNDFVITFLIFLRVIAVLGTAPIFGHQSVPAIAKVFLAGIIAYITFLTLNTAKIQVEPDFFSMAFYGLKEIITGLIIGFSLNLIFYGFSFAGMLIGNDMGLNMASALNPLQETESDVIGQVINVFAILIFFLIDGHHYIIRAVVSSFRVIPLGKYTLTQPAFDIFIRYTGAVFVIAVKIASPVMVSFFLVHLAEGIIARVIPQMPIFFVTQPLKLGLGFLLLVFILPIYMYFFKGMLASYENSLYDLIKAMGS